MNLVSVDKLLCMCNFRASIDLTGLIEARLCKIQGLFKDFSRTFLLFSRTENLRKILIYMLKFYFGNAKSPLLKI